MRKNSSRENRSLFPSRNFKWQTKGGEGEEGGGGRGIFIRGKTIDLYSRSGTNFLRQFSSLDRLIVVIGLVTIGRGPYIRHASRFFAITRTKDQSNAVVVQR